MVNAYSIKVRGVVQGVGFRPFVYRLARTNGLTGWVLNEREGVAIHLEGEEKTLRVFIEELKTQPPPSASIVTLRVMPAEPAGCTEFLILTSQRQRKPTVRVSPDLPVCADCLRDVFDPQNRRYLYPYINCTNCGPRYTVIESLPYDRCNTTMASWPLDGYCTAEYDDPANRRFHAQPVACPCCGPHYYFQSGKETERGDDEVVRIAVQRLTNGEILAIKGLGGYHLVCDATNVNSVAALRMRKYRKEKPFALMAASIAVARGLVELTPEAEELLMSMARPIVLASTKVKLPEVAPDNDELGVMLPYTPLHYLLFEAGAPEVLVMTSANRSSEPIAYEDDQAMEQLSGIADGFLIGERPIARRVDDSVVRAGVFGPAILRRARGYAPGAVAALPSERPILALGADLKNTITLVVDGQAFVSQHIGDLDHYQAFRAFQATVHDLLAMYEIQPDKLLVVHDAHPQYVSTLHALELEAAEKRTVQHHRAHIASVLAERGAWDQHVIGVSFDGTGYGDDHSIWGGELFAGSVRSGFERVAHLRTTVLPVGDEASSYPVQAAAGFLEQLHDLPDVTAQPFSFGASYHGVQCLMRKNTRTFPTTSVGRLFDTTAALAGFTRKTTFEGQAAMWLEQLARKSAETEGYPFPYSGSELDFRPLLNAVVRDRWCGRDVLEIARAFHRGIALGVCDAVKQLCSTYDTDTIVLSGGVFHNQMLLTDLKKFLERDSLVIWTNHAVPANDGGISLGQAALAAFDTPEVFGFLGEKDSKCAERAA
jgi:hydrogenase maturation protein HypF